MRAFLLPLALGATLLSACSATRSVRPVGEGEFAVGLSFGGPLILNLGVPIPAPATSVYGRYGLGAKTDLDFGVHLPVTAAMGVDLGASHLFLEQDGARPALMGGGRLLLLFNALWLGRAETPQGGRYPAEPRIFEQLHLNASWEWSERSLFWVSLDLFAQAEEAIFLPSIGVGMEWRPVALFGLGVELRQMAFASNQRFAAVSYAGLGNYGALALQLGFNFYPGAP